MEKLSPIDIIKFSPLLFPLLLGACQAPLVDAYPILDQKCKADNVTIVNGVPVASVTYILDNGQRVAVGKGSFGRHNIVTSKGNGDFTIKPANSALLPLFQDNGRFVVKNIRYEWGARRTDKLEISHSRLGHHTKFDVTIDCS